MSRDSASALGALWRGHVFLFDKERRPTTFGRAAGVRLLLIVFGLEAVRLLRNRLPLSSLPLGVEVCAYLSAALAAVRLAGVGWEQIGLIRWRQWNATEKSYLLQVIVLMNVVFYVLFAPKLRAALEDPSVLWKVLAPYLVYGFYQEVLYRGLLQTELVRRWGAVPGILVSNVLYTFGPQHYGYFSSDARLAVPMFAGIFAMGLLFAVLFHRTGNLWIPGVMHAFGNSYILGTFGRVS